LKEMPRKGIVHVTTICSPVIRREYFPAQWKVAQIIMIQKPGKPLEEASSYRPISKIFDKTMLQRLRPILEENLLLLGHQFGFRPSNK
jgi:hypothetical protein